MRHNAEAGTAQPGGAGEGGRSREGRQGRRERGGRGGKPRGPGGTPTRTRQKQTAERKPPATPQTPGGRRGGGGGEGKGGEHSVPLPLPPNGRGTANQSIGKIAKYRSLECKLINKTVNSSAFKFTYTKIGSLGERMFIHGMTSSHCTSKGTQNLGQQIREKCCPPTGLLS